MHFPLKRFLLPVVLAAALTMSFGCSHFQATKNVWKGTKDLWYEYVSPPAEIDYSEIGALGATEQALVNAMMDIDTELGKIERLMSNADRTPSRAWAEQFFVEVPWVDGFAGIRADNTVLGNIPAPDRQPVSVDWVPLLYEPEKQSSRALRADVQPGPEGPEVLVAATLYDGVDFLGVVASYFRMSSLIPRAKDSSGLVILTPVALLWSAVDYGSTPMTGVNWSEVVTKSVAGRVSNENGSFVYRVRWLANLPVIFCVVESGNFPAVQGGGLAGAEKYFPAREKLPVPELKPRSRNLFGGGSQEFVPPAPGQEAPGDTGGASDIEAGSDRSVLLQGQGQPAQGQGRVRERDLGGDATYQGPRPTQQRRQMRRVPIIIPDMEEEEYTPPPQIQRPSPFGPRPAAPAEGVADGAAEGVDAAGVGAGAQPGSAAQEEGQQPAASEAPADEVMGLDVKPVSPMLPGGRISPFGPRPAPAGTPAEAPAPAEPPEAPAAEPPAAEAPAAETPAAEAPAPEEPAPAESRVPMLPGGRISPFGPKPAPAPTESAPAEAPAADAGAAQQ